MRSWQALAVNPLRKRSDNHLLSARQDSSGSNLYSHHSILAEFNLNRPSTSVGEGFNGQARIRLVLRPVSYSRGQSGRIDYWSSQALVRHLPPIMDLGALDLQDDGAQVPSYIGAYVNPEQPGQFCPFVVYADEKDGEASHCSTYYLK